MLASLPEILPLFPLEIVVYPDEKVNLHIFEPRYKQLINECVEQQSYFGIPALYDEQMALVVTLMEVVSVVKRYPNGEMDIKTRGIQRVEITEVLHSYADKPYACGRTKALTDDPQTDIVLQQRVFELFQELNRLLDIKKRFVADAQSLRAYDIAHYMGLSRKEEYAVLTIGREQDRLLFLRAHLEKIVPIVTEAERLKEKAKLNGHFKRLPPVEL